MHVSLIFANQNTEGRREESGEVYWKTISAGDCLDSYCQRHYIRQAHTFRSASFPITITSCWMVLRFWNQAATSRPPFT